MWYAAQILGVEGTEDILGVESTEKGLGGGGGAFTRLGGEGC